MLSVKSKGNLICSTKNVRVQKNITDINNLILPSFADIWLYSAFTSDHSATRLTRLLHQTATIYDPFLRTEGVMNCKIERK
jgi:hypothetical protein